MHSTEYHSSFYIIRLKQHFAWHGTIAKALFLCAIFTALQRVLNSLRSRKIPVKTQNEDATFFIKCCILISLIISSIYKETLYLFFKKIFFFIEFFFSFFYFIDSNSKRLYLYHPDQFPDNALSPEKKNGYI